MKSPRLKEVIYVLAGVVLIALLLLASRDRAQDDSSNQDQSTATRDDVITTEKTESAASEPLDTGKIVVDGQELDSHQEGSLSGQ